MNQNCPFVAGTCSRFCSISEEKLRKTENLLHYYEKNGPLVAEFKRSAADKKQNRPEELRTYAALRKTLDYLFNTILQDAQKPLNFQYDFIFDRCRAVRQEIVIQSLSCEETIILMEPIALFLSYSLYKMFEYPIAQFDTKICRQHLQECLLTCLGCYEEVDVQCMKGSYKMQNREIIESIYMMLNMNETSSLERALKLDIKLKTSFIIGKSIEVLISYQQRAFYKTVKHISKLPHPIICAVAALRLPEIRKEMLHVFSIAYNSSSLKVPLDFLQRLLVYDKSSTLLKHLRENLGIHDSPDSDDAIRFDRKKFDSKKTLPSVPQLYVEQQFNEIHLPDVILLITL